MFALLAGVCGVLALLLLASAALKLSHKPAVVASYARAGVPESWLNRLALLLVAAALGLLAGLFWPALGVVTAGALVIYFAVAIVFHLHAGDVRALGMPILLACLAVAALWLRLHTP
jgi:hypothetical protein